MSYLDIGILNFDNSRYLISEPDDIYWYKLRYEFDAVFYLESEIAQRDRFYSVCEDLDLFPIYGLRVQLATTDEKLDVIVCPKSIDNMSAIEGLSAKAKNSYLTLNDISLIRDQVIVGLTLGKNAVNIESIYGVSKYIVKPDFVFLQYDVIYSTYYELYCDGAFLFLENSGIITIPYRTQNKECWRYFFEEIDKTADEGRKAFMRLFSKE